MSGRCENGLDAVRIGLSPGDAADGNIVGSLEANPNAALASRFEMKPKVSLPPLPLDLSEYPDPFPSLGWERLLPYDLQSPRGLRPYQIYLEEFYNIHNTSADVAALAPRKCLEKENNLEYCWGKFTNYSLPVISKSIKECMIQFMVKKGGESEHPFVFDAAACIAEEAELMIDWLMRGFDTPGEEYMLCYQIRRLAYELAIFKGEWSAEIAATLLGIKKEAQWLRENMDGSVESIETSMQIRRFALEFLEYKFKSESGYSSEGSSVACEIDDVWSDDEEDDSWESGTCKTCIAKQSINCDGKLA